MMDAVWDVWGHRNSVEKEDAASQASREVNVHIVEERRKRFNGLDRKSQKLTRQRMDLLVKKHLDCRQAWLLSVEAAPSRAERRRQWHMPPHSVLETVGCAEWRRQQLRGFCGNLIQAWCDLTHWTLVEG